MPTPHEDDDIIPGLPGLDGDDEPVPMPETDEDIAGDGDERIGLDVETGIDEEDDFGEVDDGAGNEDRWLEGTDEAEDAAPAEDGIDGVEAEGQTWTEGSEETDDPALEEDDLPDDDGDSTGIDRGEEGVDDRDAPGGDDDAAAELPPLAADAVDEAAEDLDLREEGEIENAPEIEADLASAAPLPPRLPEDRVTTEHLGPVGEAIVTVTALGGRVLAGGSRLYALGDGARPALVALGAAGLETHEIATVTLDPHDPLRIAVGTRLGGALSSVDGGETFSEINGWRHREPGNVTVPFLVLGEPHATGTRLWGRTRAGALYRSEDFGATWVGPVLPPQVAAITVDPAGGVVAVLFGRRGGEQLARSDDGGRGWRLTEPVELLRGEGDVLVAALGAVTAMARDGDAEGAYYTRDAGASWTATRALRDATALALVEEGAQISLYAAMFLEGEDRGVIVRQVLGGAANVVLDVERERATRGLEGPDDSEGEGRVHDIAASYADGKTTLLVATQVGVFRVVVRFEP